LLGALLARLKREVTHRHLEFEAAGLKKQSESSVKPVV
jgi:hypothetical protein